MQNVCNECGANNAVGAEFCAFCHTFLAWDDEHERPPRATTGDASRQTAGVAARGHVAAHPRVAGIDAAATTGGGTSTSSAAQHAPADSTAGRFRVQTDHDEVTVAATGEPTTIDLRIANTSTIVDGYVAEAPGAPRWLQLEASEIQLLPGTNQTLTARIRVASDTLVPAQNGRLLLRVRSMSQAPAHLDVPITFIVPALDVPVRLRAEPRLLRVSDRDSAEGGLVVDNSGSNRPVRLTFAGSDPELAVAFRFEPPELEVGPGASASVRVTVTAAGPAPGQQISRPLTIKALEGSRSVDTLITLHQATSTRVEDPPVGLEVQPSLLRVRDSTGGVVRVVADNRRGTQWAHLKFKASDPEDLVRVIWAPSSLDVPPGKSIWAEARLEAPQPVAGSEVSRTVTVRASNGPQTSTATATLVQVSSASPMSTLGLRIEPSVVRVRDADTANVQVIVDNRRGHAPVRASLHGTDPERVVHFAFSSPSVQVDAGQMQTVALRVDCRRPEPDRESTRQFTITAGDGHDHVEASGSLVQTSSPAAIELLRIRLDPSVLRLSPWRRGMLAAVLDNRNGAHPVRVEMTGDDPENIVGFQFAPRVLVVPAGRVASTRVTLKINRAPGRLELTRPFTILASDGRSEAEAEGEVIQGAADYRPLARVLLTILGGLAMILGAFLPWLAISPLRGVQLHAGILAQAFGASLDLGGAERMVSAGLIAIALGVLTIFGLTGRTGRLTRLSSLLAALLLVALLIAFSLVGINARPGAGALLVLLGCVAAYVGGLLARR